MPPSPERATATQDRSGRPDWEVADIFRLYGEAYRRVHPLPACHLRVMEAIQRCRTAALGGHLEQCDACGYQRPVYNSCRNRHCPKCQSLAKAEWLQARQAELLPVPYFHMVFTLPHELNPVLFSNKRVAFNLLFASVAHTLLEFGRNNLGGALGFIAVLHTWDQKLLDHVHLHVLIPAGALSCDGERWIASREDFLFPVRALSRVFRGKFLDALNQAFFRGQLVLAGNTAPLARREAFARFLVALRRKPWVVYAKKPFAGPAQVLDYLGRYTHRVALSNRRIIDVDHGRVTFRYKDRRDADSVKAMTLQAHEFIRRFLLHVVPQGFMRIRYFGFLANRCKARNLRRCRRLLDVSADPPEPAPKTVRERMLQLTGLDIARCPHCQKGTMICIADLQPGSPDALDAVPVPPALLDSS